MDKHEMTLGEYRDYCAEADARIASLTEAVRVLSEALENIAQDCEADYPPSHGAIKHAARAALTTAKELTK